MKKIAFVFFIAGCSSLINAQDANDATKFPSPVTFTAKQDHENMMMQLGIKSLRPGPGGNKPANYDESLANPCPELPDILMTNKGKKVTTAAQWWNIRRAELQNGLELEMYGKMPEKTPKVNWEVKITDREFIGKIPVIAKQLIGHVDNSNYPLITVDIDMMLVLPTNVKGPVPVLIMFSGPTSLPAPGQPSPDDMVQINKAFKEMMIKSNPEMKDIFDKYPAYAPITRLDGPNFWGPDPDGNSAPTEQLLAAGWGYVQINPNSIQADNGAGLTKGIIGLVNKGQPRKPDDWGSLRAWAWGAARALDYLETEPMVDAGKVGIEGVSRYGKAALVTLAFEPRFAVGLIGSSGKGGAALARRNFGEAVETLASSGEYHWMAGNYLKYAAAEASFGSKTGCDFTVDTHELIALCAPRLAFISYGIPEKGDSEWLDQQGSWMATVAAGTVYKLLGARDLGVSNDYRTEKRPPVLTGLMDGELAWRQHDGGHTDAPNFQFFIPWASKMMKYNKVSAR
ncbi:MAG: acetylxylan esterase [Bacteroidales bacterium]|nr:acetylxylan esterase [Bacteroidales bacterium]